MARPSLSAKVTAKNLTNAEKTARIETEERLRGNADNIKPLPHLNAAQVEMFNFIVGELEKSDMLSNLDAMVLSDCAICIDRLAEIEKTMNDEPEKRFDGALIRARTTYSKDFQRYCNELCLSPQSRAKIANINMQKETRNPLLDILSDSEYDD